MGMGLNHQEIKNCFVLQRERRSRGASPVTEMLRSSMRKANAPLAPDRRRVSRQLLTDMNVAQLQVSPYWASSTMISLSSSYILQSHSFFTRTFPCGSRMDYDHAPIVAL